MAAIGPPGRRRARRLRALQRQRRPHPGPAGRRRGRRGRRGHPLGRARRCREMIAAFAKGDVGAGPGGQRPPARVLRLRDGRRRPQPHPGQGHDAGARACPWASAACPWGRRPAGLEDRARAGPRRPRAHRSMALSPVRITFLGGLGEIGRNCACIELDGRIMHPRLRADVPRRRDAGHRPRAARLHLAARERRPRRGLHPHPRPRGPRRRAVASSCATCRSRSTARRSPWAWPATASRRPGCSTAPSSSPWSTASAAASARSTASSSPSPTRCPTASPPPSTRPRA